MTTRSDDGGGPAGSRGTSGAPGGGLALLHQDQELLVFLKPSGMPSTRHAGQDSRTAVHEALALFPDLPFPDSLERGLLHRLDTGTSGALAFARTEAAWEKYRKAWKSEVTKIYRAVAGAVAEQAAGPGAGPTSVGGGGAEQVRVGAGAGQALVGGGDFVRERGRDRAPSSRERGGGRDLSSKDRGLGRELQDPIALLGPLPRDIRLEIAHDAKSSKRMRVLDPSLALPLKEQLRRIRGRPQPAHTRILGATPISGGLADVEIQIFSGVMHQIRAHLAHLGLPLVGDEIYRGRESSRLWLHAWKLELGGRTIVAPLPPDWPA